MNTPTQKKKPLKKLVIIKKSRWSRQGTSKGCRKNYTRNSLRCRDGKMCCLGFICIQAFAAKPSEITDCSFCPGDCSMEEIVVAPKWYSTRMTDAVVINDEAETSDAVKIRLLNKLFNKSPIKLKFVP